MKYIVFIVLNKFIWIKTNSNVIDLIIKIIIIRALRSAKTWNVIILYWTKKKIPMTLKCYLKFSNCVCTFNDL